MEIKEVSYRRVVPVGSYSTVAIGLTASVGPSESVEQVVKALDAQIVSLLNGGGAVPPQAPGTVAYDSSVDTF